MLIGILLILTWLVLLIRYPAKALPISAAALIGLLLVGAWMYWLDQREKRQLAHLELRIAFAPERCPADRPLALDLKNGARAPLQELRWDVAAYRPGDTVNLARNLYDAPRYRGPGELLPGDSWQDCLPLPTLRAGYRAATLEYRAERIQGSFAN
ncbi:multidrug transporter [Pseudomonas sp. UL073]|uniref:Multidrug transporter n=1 Tax=Zestomonas insulae TaxID=2809017 RepID=A0ABS2IDU6_9GAMM|nr:multidrug transporter [Pseudomonas insulae]MBM7060050.1 multidrug transporter [Pseudomonas insulae]